MIRNFNSEKRTTSKRFNFKKTFSKDFQKFKKPKDPSDPKCATASSHSNFRFQSSISSSVSKSSFQSEPFRIFLDRQLVLDQCFERVQCARTRSNSFNEISVNNAGVDSLTSVHPP